jgi:hypothetical protein
MAFMNASPFIRVMKAHGGEGVKAAPLAEAHERRFREKVIDPFVRSYWSAPIG